MQKEFIKDSTFSLLTHMLIYLKSIFFIPVIIKTVGISMCGSFSLLASMAGIVFGISSLGVGVKSYRYLPSAETAEQRALLFYPPFYFQIMMLLIFSVLILLFQDTIVSLISDKQNIFSIYIIPLYLVLYAVYARSYSYMRFTSKIGYLNIMGLLYAYGHVGFVLIYIYATGVISINLLFVSQAIVAFAVSLPFVFLIYREINIRFIFLTFDEIKNGIRIGFPLTLNFIVDFILAASDRFVLAYFMGAYAVGLYVPAYTLGAVILIVPKSLGTVVPQMMSKSVDTENFNQAKSLFSNSIKAFMAIAVPFVFGTYLIEYDALMLLANEEVACEGRYIAVIIACSSLFYGLNILMSQANMVDLKTGIIFKANTIAAFFNLAANIIVLYFIQSIYVPAVATLISFMIATAYFYKSLDKKWSDSGLWGVSLKICTASLLMFIFTYGLTALMPPLSPLFSLTVKIIIAVFLYTILVVKLGIYSKQQIKNLKAVFRQ